MLTGDGRTAYVAYCNNNNGSAMDRTNVVLQKMYWLLFISNRCPFCFLTGESQVFTASQDTIGCGCSRYRTCFLSTYLLPYSYLTKNVPPGPPAGRQLAPPLPTYAPSYLRRVPTYPPTPRSLYALAYTHLHIY